MNAQTTTRNLLDVWSSTGFAHHELTAYASNVMLEETRRGLVVMSSLARAAHHDQVAMTE